jgi:hypothetical protein
VGGIVESLISKREFIVVDALDSVASSVFGGRGDGGHDADRCPMNIGNWL